MSQRTRLLLILGGGVLALAVASGALAVALVSDDEPNRRTSSLPEPAPGPTRTVPASLPAELRQRIERLPERLREAILLAYEEGAMTRQGIEDMLRQYDSRNPSVRVGQVLDASATRLTLGVYTTGERVDVAIDDKTVLRRGKDAIKPADLKRDELVMVLSMDGGATAFSVTAFGVSAPR